MTYFLASVQDDDEAEIAVAGGADVIDFKNPAQGALGALDPAAIASGLQRIAGRARTSATAGDWPLQPSVLTQAARQIGATGIDYVKLGLLAGDALGSCIEALAAPAGQYRLVAVFFADRGVPLDALPRLRNAGFAGAMIDTFDKQAGGLRRHLSDEHLRDFIAAARHLGLMAGLAGSLRIEDIAPLCAFDPDLLGFRGALCDSANRRARLSLERVRQARQALNLVAALKSDLTEDPRRFTPEASDAGSIT